MYYFKLNKRKEVYSFKIELKIYIINLSLAGNVSLKKEVNLDKGYINSLN